MSGYFVMCPCYAHVVRVMHIPAEENALIDYFRERTLSLHPAKIQNFTGGGGGLKAFFADPIECDCSTPDRFPNTKCPVCGTILDYQ